jgi:hypothetical protein
MLEEMGTN